ncbi:MAG: Uma2 family endonuclease [Nitrococcus sp.]|nr:Uma2 family endonuclease [Nitrococcus sp.]
MTVRTSSHQFGINDYLEGELLSEVRHEYIGGEVYAMVGASDRHNLIVGNIFAALHPLVRGTPCQLFMADMKLHLTVAGEDAFYYPDLMLTCDPHHRARYYREHPCLIVEVLSDATERIDRREKLLAYSRIESLQEYLLLAQNEPLAELHRRRDDWHAQRIHEGSVPIECLDTALDIDTIYEGLPPIEASRLG